VDEDDEDDFMPDAQEEPEDDDFNEDEVDDEDDDDEEGEAVEEEDSGEDYAGPRRPSMRNVSSIEFDQSRDPHPFLTKHKKKPPADVRSPIAFAKGSGVRVQTTDYRLRTRGVADFSKIGGQEIRLKDLFGPENEALKPVLDTRDYWHHQETFPVRSPDGCRRSFFDSPAAREQEEKSIRAWYTETGRSVFDERQEARMLTAEDGNRFLATDGPQALNVLWGAAQSPRVRTFNQGACVSLNEAFDGTACRRGWLFHLGARVQEAQWAPKEEGRTQYLAVAVEQKPMEGWQPNRLEQPKAPAFTASAPFPASIQIWAFDMASDDKSDILKEPRLEQVICATWGAPKQLRWCPIQASDAKETSDDDGDGHVGLLAGIWSDGRVRILDVRRPRPEDVVDGPAYVHYTRTAFDVAIPDTVPSCLHWLSASSLAVATAAGTVGIWTLSRPGTFAANAKPWFYRRLAETYILTISSGWPSQPQFISLSVADGFARLFDLRSPNADTTASIRGRTLCISQAWHEQTQTFVMPDEHYILKHTPIRRYYHNLYSMRLESSITRVATSPVHPAMLVASVEGIVEASNPIGRIANYKVIPWQQKWFVHEWRRPVDELVVKPATAEVAAGETPTTTPPPSPPPSETLNIASTPAPISKKVPEEILSHPLSRITEGYKAIQPGIQHSVASKKPHNPEMNKGLTIYEANSAITVLAWNPNLKYGTWAVAGMADGLLRVEDVGV